MTEGDARRALTAIVFADVVGYSRLMGEDDAGTVALLRRRRAEVVDPLIAAFGGRLVNAAGDSLLIEFASVVAAAQFAISMQQQNAALDAASGPAMPFRLGVNLGDVVVRDRAVFGDSVNVAARLQALAEPGGICLSGAVYDQVRGQIAAEFVDAGAHHVKNIARPVAVYSLSPAAIAAAPRFSGARRRMSQRWIFAGLAALALAVAASVGLPRWFASHSRADFAASLDQLLATTQGKLGTDARAKLVSEYLAQRPHRALALAPLAQNHWWTGDWPDEQTASEKALERCQMAFRESCALAARDENLVEEPGRSTRDMPRVAYEGKFDLTQIPAARAIVLQRADLQQYSSATGHKAVAIHPRGIIVVVLSAETDRRAEIAALKACNDDDSRRESDGPCFLYAAGDQVVLPKRATTAISPKS